MTIAADFLALGTTRESHRLPCGVRVDILGPHLTPNYGQLLRDVSLFTVPLAKQIARVQRTDWRLEFDRIQRWAKIARFAHDVPETYREAAMAVRVEMLAYHGRYERAKAEFAAFAAGRAASPSLAGVASGNPDGRMVGTGA